MAIVDELVAILGYDLRGEENLRKFNQGLERTAERAKAITATLVRVGAVAGAAMGAAMVGLGKAVISTTAQFESFEATLTTIEGSSEKARESMGWVADFAKRTPYDLAGVTDAFVRLKAYGLDPTNGTLEAVGNATSAMGKSLMQGVEAIADAATGEFERLKEFGIKSKVAGDQVTFSWSKNGEELTKTVKKNSTEIVKFLGENFGDRFNGAMLRQSKTWNGMVANLGDSWEDFKLRIGRSGFFDTVKNRLGDILDRIAELDANGTLDRWAKRIGGALTTVVDVTSRVVSRLGQVAGAIGGVFGGGAWTGAKVAMAGLAVWLNPIAAAVVAMALAAEDFKTYLEGGESVIGRMIEKVTKLKDEFLALIGLGGHNPFVLPADPATVQGSADLLKDPSFSPYAKGGRFFRDEAARKAEAARINGQGIGMTSDAEDWKWALQNLEGNLAKMDGANAASATLNDNKEDNRDQSVTTTVNVGGVHVQQATQAPGAVGQAVGNAAGQAATRRASRFEMEPAF